MTRLPILAAASLAASTAAAHPGHFADVAGHSHWLEYAALGAGGLVAVLAARIGLRRLSGRGAGDRGE